MKKRTRLNAAFVSVLLLSTTVAAQFVNFGQANSYIRVWKKVGAIPPPDGTLPPTISILSPQNNSAYASNNVSLVFNVSMPESNDVSLYVSTYYVPSWQHKGNKLVKISAYPGSINLTDVPEGPRWLEVYAVASAFAYETGHEIEDMFYTKYYVAYEITSYSIVKFTIDNTPPIISAISVENKTYGTADIPLNVIVNEPVSQVIYSLDGQRNVTAAGNTTLTELSNGNHNVTVYATDEAGNTGTSEDRYFIVDVAEPFSTASVAASVASVAIAVSAITSYFVKNRKKEKTS